MMIVPAEYEFLVGPISFSGPYCQANIVFQVNSNILDFLYLNDPVTKEYFQII